MKKTVSFFCMVVLASGIFYSCQQDQQAVDPYSISSDVRNQLISLGFDVVKHPPMSFDDGYLVEGDIYLTPSDLSSMERGKRVPTVEQYSTNQLVTALPRTITVYMPTNFSAANFSGVDEAIRRYNAENLQVKFQR